MCWTIEMTQRDLFMCFWCWLRHMAIANWLLNFIADIIICQQNVTFENQIITVYMYNSNLFDMQVRGLIRLYEISDCELIINCTGQTSWITAWHFSLLYGKNAFSLEWDHAANILDLIKIVRQSNTNRIAITEDTIFEL